jgi:predicted transcriptional regulator of viral defense system
MKVVTPHDKTAMLARAQHALVTRRQALDAGMTPEQVEHLVRSRRWERLYRSVYRIGGVPETHEQRILAAVLGAGPGAVASHLAAGFLWKLRGVVPESLDVTVERDRQPRLRGVNLHRVNRFPEEDRRVVRGIPTTSVPRLLVDLSAFWSPGQLRVALDEMLRRHETTLGSVERCVRRLESARGRRCAVIAMLVKERKQVPVVGESHLEQRIFEPLVAAGVELPVPQFEVVVVGQRFRLDFAWPDAKLYVEVDGFDTHRMYSDFHRDRRREALLVAEGWTPLHFTEISRPEEIVDRVTTTLARLSRVG